MTGRSGVPLVLALVAATFACRGTSEGVREARAPASCPAPSGSWSTAGRDPLVADPPPIAPVQNVITLHGDERTSWNGQAAERDRVREYLRITADMSPQPRLLVDIRRGASCVAAAALAQEIERHLRCTPRICRWGI